MDYSSHDWRIGPSRVAIPELVGLWVQSTIPAAAQHGNEIGQRCGVDITAAGIQMLVAETGIGRIIGSGVRASGSTVSQRLPGPEV